MISFSINMKSLFTENNISLTDETRGFIEVRNNTRKNAAIYTESVLPLSESIVQRISTFVDYYQYLNLEDWGETIDDQIEELDHAVADCNLMIQMHESITTALNKDRNKATVEIEKIKMTAEKFESLAKTLKIGSSIETGCCLALAALALTISTGGVATAGCVFAGTATAVMGTAEIAVKKKANISHNNIDLVLSSVKALDSFLSGLRGLSSFFISTRSSLTSMRIHSDKASKTKKAHFFKIMKGVAEKIDNKCKMFLNVAQLLRSELGSIPYEISDKNYVDKWLEEELKKYKKAFKRDALALLSQVNWSERHNFLTNKKD